MASVEERVKQIIVEQLGVDEGEVTPTASFVDDLGADSLDTVELVMAFEEAFGIEIPDEDAEKIATVKDAIEYIEKHAKAEVAPAGSSYPEQEKFPLNRRVVVTGVGLVCGCGIGTEEVWRNLLAGKSGIGRVTHFDATAFDCRIAGEVKRFRSAELGREKRTEEDGAVHSARHGRIGFRGAAWPGWKSRRKSRIPPAFTSARASADST